MSIHVKTAPFVTYDVAENSGNGPVHTRTRIVQLMNMFEFIAAAAAAVSGWRNAWASCAASPSANYHTFWAGGPLVPAERATWYVLPVHITLHDFPVH